MGGVAVQGADRDPEAAGQQGGVQVNLDAPPPRLLVHGPGEAEQGDGFRAPTTSLGEGKPAQLVCDRGRHQHGSHSPRSAPGRECSPRGREAHHRWQRIERRSALPFSRGRCPLPVGIDDARCVPFGVVVGTISERCRDPARRWTRPGSAACPSRCLTGVHPNWTSGSRAKRIRLGFPPSLVDIARATSKTSPGHAH